MESNHQPKVSVIVPIYNVEKYIERCVRSLMEQTLDDIEYIFVNDATPDNSMGVLNRVINEYPEKLPMIKIFNHEVNKGQSSARNLGIKISTGKYIFFVDSDDEITEDAIEILYNKAQYYKVDFSMGENLICNIEKYSNRGNVYVDIKLDENRIYHEEEIIRTYMLGLWYNVPVVKLVRRDLIVSNSLFFAEGFKFEDELWSMQLAMTAKSMVVIKKPLYIYYVKGGSTMTEGWNKRFDGLKKLLPIMKDYILSSNKSTNIYIKYFFLMKCLSVMNSIKKWDYDKYRFFHNLIYFKTTELYRNKLISYKQNFAYYDLSIPDNIGYVYFRMMNFILKIKNYVIKK